ncbi:MAG: hypothetical protein AAF570_00775, partial [Bacteroidota bacterium]
MLRTLMLTLLCTAAFSVSALKSAQFMVTNTMSTGGGSFSQAILDAQGAPGHDTITFNLIGTGPFQIASSAGFISIASSVFIDGRSQAGNGPGNWEIEIVDRLIVLRADTRITGLHFRGSSGAVSVFVTAGEPMMNGTEIFDNRFSGGGMGVHLRAVQNNATLHLGQTGVHDNIFTGDLDLAVNVQGSGSGAGAVGSIDSLMIHDNLIDSIKSGIEFQLTSSANGLG